jgi:hypothetical protein
MKRFPTFLLLLALAFTASCGKDNKTGRNNGWDFGSAGINPYTGTPLAQGNFAVAQVINENPCGGGMMGGGFGMGMQRMQVQLPIQNFPTVIGPNEVYVGVTSFGDVAALIGTGGVPTFVAFLCPRMAQPLSVSNITIGAYSQCAFKPLTKADVRFGDGSVALFRWMDAGNSVGQKFSYCR